MQWRKWRYGEYRFLRRRRQFSSSQQEGKAETHRRSWQTLVRESLEKTRTGESKFTSADYALLGFPAVMCFALYVWKEDNEKLAPVREQQRSTSGC